MEYTRLTTEQKQQMLESRLVQLEAEHFANYLNKQAAETLPDSDEKTATIEQAEANMSAIEAAHEAVLTEAESLT